MPSGSKIKSAQFFLYCAVFYAALFNLETSPFRHIIPSRPFSECLNNQLDFDTYIYLYGGNIITKGLMPYRDFFDHKGPLVYIMMAAGIMIGKIAGVWLIQAALLVVAAVYAYRTARILVSPWASALAAGLLVLWYSQGCSRPDAMSVPFLLISLFFLVRYLTNGYQIKNRETLLVGLTFGSVLFLKANLTALWIIFIVTVILASLRKREYLTLFVRALVFLAGAAIICLPILYWIWIKDAFPDFIKDYWIYNTSVYGGKASFSDYLLFFIPETGKVGISTWIRHFWFNLPSLFVYFLLLTRRPGSRKNLYLVLAVYLLSSILLIGMKGLLLVIHGQSTRHFLTYYAYPLSAAYLVFFALSFEFILKQFSKRPLLGCLLFLFLSVPVLRPLCPPIVRDWISIRWAAKHFPAKDLSPFGFPIRTDRPMLELAEWIKKNTEKNCKINGADARVYWYADRLCVSNCFFEWARKSYDLTFPRDSHGNLPKYLFERRRQNLTFKQILSLPLEEQKNYGTSPEIEQALAKEYHLVYQNECFDFYQLNGSDEPENQSTENTEH